MLKDLIRYTEIADLIVINALHNLNKGLPQAQALFSHILNAQHIWLSRIHQCEQLYDRFQIHPVESFLGIHKTHIAALKDLAATDLNFKVNYSNSEGISFEDQASDIVLQIINHSTYHRAQIATQFRLNGIEPPVTDYIVLKRRNLL